jgi:DNA-binding MarR family transcriptional regulator
MKLEDEIVQKQFRNPYHKAAVNVVYTCNWLMAFQEKFFKSLGLTPQQYNILRILRGQHPHPASVKLIRERMLDKMSDASRLVEKLRKKGLVTRNPCKNDRRGVDVVITNKGLDLLVEMDNHNNEMDKFLSHLDEKEIGQLNILLDKLRG